jgi:hypothetical protein
MWAIRLIDVDDGVGERVCDYTFKCTQVIVERLLCVCVCVCVPFVTFKSTAR